MSVRNAWATATWKARNYLHTRRLLLPYSPSAVGTLLAQAGFDPGKYRNAYPDLVAGLPSDAAALLHFCQFADEDTRNFPVELVAKGLTAIANSRLRKTLKARLFAALFASYCVPWSPLWNRLPADFEAFWSEVVSALGRDFKLFVVTGDSHCHIYCRLFESGGRIFIPIPLICYAASARGLISRTSRSGAHIRLSRMAKALERAGGGIPVLFKFGQVDIEFVFDFHRAEAGETAFSDEKWEAFATRSATNYADFVADHFHAHPIRVMGVFPPALSDEMLRAGYANASVVASEGVSDLSELVQALRKLTFADKAHRTRLHALFNRRLAEQAERRKIPYFDDFPFYLSAAGILDDAYIATHKGTDHHLEKQATKTTAVKIIEQALRDMNYL